MIGVNEALDMIKSRDTIISDMGKQLTILQQEMHTMIFRQSEFLHSYKNLVDAIQRHNDRLDILEHKVKMLGAIAHEMKAMEE